MVGMVGDKRARGRMGGGLIGRWRHDGGCEKRGHVRSLSNGRHPQSAHPPSLIHPFYTSLPYFSLIRHNPLYPTLPSSPPSCLPVIPHRFASPSYHHAPNSYTRRTELWLRATCIYRCLYVCMCVRVCVRVYVCIYIYVYIYKRVYRVACTGRFSCGALYVLMYIYAHTHTHAYYTNSYMLLCVGEYVRSYSCISE